MVKNRRLEYVAKMARDLVLGVREKGVANRRGLRSLSQLDISGYSFGSHIAGQTCQYLREKVGARTNEKVRLLLGMCSSFKIVFWTKV